MLIVVQLLYPMLIVTEVRSEWPWRVVVVMFHHQNSWQEGLSFWQIFGFGDDRIELLSENTTNSVCRVKGANGDWLVVK